MFIEWVNECINDGKKKVKAAGRREIDIIKQPARMNLLQLHWNNKFSRRVSRQIGENEEYNGGVFTVFKSLQDPWREKSFSRI